MAKIYCIGDTHFGDDRVRDYENRPFESVEIMDKSIIENWNNTVSDNDVVFHFGDVSLYDADKTKKLVQQLHGTKFLIRGNHDLLTSSDYRKMGFKNVYDYPIIYDDFYMFSHKPLYVNSNMPYANIFCTRTFESDVQHSISSKFLR